MEHLVTRTEIMDEPHDTPDVGTHGVIIKPHHLSNGKQGTLTCINIYESVKLLIIKNEITVKIQVWEDIYFA